MTKIVLKVKDEQKAKSLVVLLRDLDYVDLETDEDLKVWDCDLPAIDNPVFVRDFRIYSRDELHER